MAIAHKRYLFPLLLFLIVFSPASAFAVPVGSLTKVEGKVDILRSAGRIPEEARLGDTLSPGDVIRTKRTGKAEIRFHDDSVIQLAPESRLRIDDYVMTRDNDRTTGLLSLLRGKVRALVSKTKGIVQTKSATDSNFMIKTRTAIAGVKGTSLIMFYDRGISGVIFTGGHGFVYNPSAPDRVVPMSAGQATLVLGRGAPPAPPRTVSSSQVAIHTQAVTVSSRGPQAQAEPVSTGGMQGQAPDARSSIVADNAGITTLMNELIDLPVADAVDAGPVFLADDGPDNDPEPPPMNPELPVSAVTVNVSIPR